ncbi:SGM_3592 family protein [Streptomyces smaragdinus]|uniref:SGM_3592 family protein n=1 Tax=Streptomyces smaragdinus TaxID=2585196 RepID=UPI001295A331|nr:hypothetical protein [Streptomyces smaragdinus]
MIDSLHHRDRAGSPEEPGPALDEEFVRAAPVKEPSARSRILAAQWRRQAPEPRPWRADKPPAGWFFSRPRRRWRRC